MKVAIIVGHGGSATGVYDPGACANGQQEYQLAKQLVEKIGSVFKRYDCQSEIYNLDAKLGLQKKINMFQSKQSADLVIECHLNSATAAAKGTEVFYYGADGTAKAIAADLSANLANALGTVNRGAKTGDHLGFISKTIPRSLLVEFGFISNPEECAKMCESNYQNNIASAFCKSIAGMLGIGMIESAPTPIPATYRVRLSWEDVKSQVGAYTVLENAVQKANECKSNVYDSAGTLVWKYIEPTVPSIDENPSKEELDDNKSRTEDSGQGASKDITASGGDSGTNVQPDSSSMDGEHSGTGELASVPNIDTQVKQSVFRLLLDLLKRIFSIK